MKTKILLSAISFFLATSFTQASQTAIARMYCVSIEVDHGVNQYGDTIDMNFSGVPSGVGEFAPWWPNGSGSINDITLPDIVTHVSSMNIYDSYYGYTSIGTITVDLPMTDLNNNRFPDFFEVARSANYTTSGSYNFNDGMFSFYDYGQISTATFTRSAGARSGTYAFTFYDSTITPNYWGTFHGTFKILEYKGTLTYTPGTSLVSGTINLTQTGVAGSTLQGPIQFLKVDSDRFNSLTNLPSTWTDASAQVYNVTNHYFFRDPNYATNYAGYIEFGDDLSQQNIYPWAIWVLSITDTNDVNHNGIPDFSDDPSTPVPPRQPRVSMTLTSTNLLFTIAGDVNHLHTIQQAPDLTSSAWQDVVSVMLTSDPQVVPVPTPSGSTFFRVKAQ